MKLEKLRLVDVKQEVQKNHTTNIPHALKNIAAKDDKTKIMNRIKLMQLVKEVIKEANENQVLDAIATLKALKLAVNSGSEVTVDGQPLFKMPFINLATLQGGGKVEFPRDERLESMNIMVDGEPLELVYKEAPTSIAPAEKTPEEIAAAKQAWQDRYGPNGGYDTVFGRYTGD